MKFNYGQWVMKPGVSSHNCEQIREVHVLEDGARIHLYGVCHRRDERALDGPALELDITSPREDIIRVQLVHFKGSRAKMPEFVLNDKNAKCRWKRRTRC